MEEFYIVNSIQKNERKKNWDQLLDAGMQKQKQFWNRDAKGSTKTSSSHIYIKETKLLSKCVIAIVSEEFLFVVDNFNWFC